MDSKILRFISDIYKKVFKCYPTLSELPSLVRFRSFRFQAQSEIFHRGYRAVCPPIDV
jgi:hypothetical protein